MYASYFVLVTAYRSLSPARTNMSAKLFCTCGYNLQVIGPSRNYGTMTSDKVSSLPRKMDAHYVRIRRAGRREISHGEAHPGERLNDTAKTKTTAFSFRADFPSFFSPSHPAVRFHEYLRTRVPAPSRALLWFRVAAMDDAKSPAR